MPELPDVEGFRRLLESHVVGKEVTAVEVFDPGVVRGRSAQDFCSAWRGTGSVSRTGMASGCWPRRTVRRFCSTSE